MLLLLACLTRPAPTPAACRPQMLTQHPLAFAATIGTGKAPLLDVQTNRNLERYIDPYDPTLGVRGEGFTPEQAQVSAEAFNRYLKKQPFFDKNIAEAY